MTVTEKGQRKNHTETGGAITGYESDLWRMSDALRGSMDAAEYKHPVKLGHVTIPGKTRDDLPPWGHKTAHWSSQD